MEVFCYNMSKPRETLDSFNHRLQSFCMDNMVVASALSMMGPTAIVSLTLADDVDMPSANTLTVFTALTEGLNDNLEEDITSIIGDLVAVNSEESPCIPYSFDTAVRTDLPIAGIAMISCINGMVVDEEEEDED